MIRTYMSDDLINKSTLLKCVLMAGHEEMISTKMQKAAGYALYVITHQRKIITCMSILNQSM